MTSSTTGLIGLEHLGPEPCDGTGDDPMSIRARRKWHVGVIAEPRASIDAEPQTVDYDALGAFILNQCSVDPGALRLVATWQHSMQPVRPRRKLNPAILSDIVSAEAHKALRFGLARKVAKIYMMNKQFHEMILRQLDASNTVLILRRDVIQLGWFGLDLEPALFCALCEHKRLVFPEVVLMNDVWELYDLYLLGIERLDLDYLTEAEDVARIIVKNRDSLKVLTMPQWLFNHLPDGLKLDEFCTWSPQGIQGNLFEVPRKLDTKVFKCSYRNPFWGYSGDDRIKVPPQFIRRIKADEVHLDVYRIAPNTAELPASEPSNPRVKKLVVVVECNTLDDFHFDRMIRDVFAMCPALECFEVVYEHQASRRSLDFPDKKLDYEAVDMLNAKFESAIENCRVPFAICLKMFVQYTVDSKAEASDFARRRFNTDLSPACSDHGGWEHYHLVKESSFGKTSVRTDFRISVKPENWSANDWW